MPSYNMGSVRRHRGMTDPCSTDPPLSREVRVTDVVGPMNLGPRSPRRCRGPVVLVGLRGVTPLTLKSDPLVGVGATDSSVLRNGKPLVHVTRLPLRCGLSVSVWGVTDLVGPWDWTTLGLRSPENKKRVFLFGEDQNSTRIDPLSHRLSVP